MDLYKPKKFIIGLCSTVVVYFIIFNNLPVKEIFFSIAKADFTIIGLTVLISVIFNIFVSSYRYALILRELNIMISWKEALIIKTGSDVVSRCLPMKAGEITRVLYLNRVKSMAYDNSVFSVLIEYFLNFLTILILFCIGIAMYYFDQKNNFHGFITGPFWLFCVSTSEDIQDYGTLGKKIKKVIYFIYDKFKLESSRIFRNKKILAYTFLMLGAQLFNFYLIAFSFNVIIPIYAILIYIPVIIVLTCLP